MHSRITMCYELVKIAGDPVYLEEDDGEDDGLVKSLKKILLLKMFTLSRIEIDV